MHLQDILYTQGFGTRRVCAGLVQQGHVVIGGKAVDDPFADIDPKAFNTRCRAPRGRTTRRPT